MEPSKDLSALLGRSEAEPARKAAASKPASTRSARRPPTPDALPPLRPVSSPVPAPASEARLASCMQRTPELPVCGARLTRQEQAQCHGCVPRVAMQSRSSMPSAGMWTAGMSVMGPPVNTIQYCPHPSLRPWCWQSEVCTSRPTGAHLQACARGSCTAPQRQQPSRGRARPPQPSPQGPPPPRARGRAACLQARPPQTWHPCQPRTGTPVRHCPPSWQQGCTYPLHSPSC